MYYEGDRTPEEKQFETYCDQLEVLEMLLCRLLPENLVPESGGSHDYSLELQGEDNAPRWVTLAIRYFGTEKIRTVSISKLFGDEPGEDFFMETSKVEIIEEAQKNDEPLLFITVVFNETTLVKESMQTPEYDPKKMERLRKFLAQVKAQPLDQVRERTRAALQRVQS